MRDSGCGCCDFACDQDRVFDSGCCDRGKGLDSVQDLVNDCDLSFTDSGLDFGPDIDYAFVNDYGFCGCGLVLDYDSDSGFFI